MSILKQMKRRKNVKKKKLRKANSRTNFQNYLRVRIYILSGIRIMISFGRKDEGTSRLKCLTNLVHL